MAERRLTAEQALAYLRESPTRIAAMTDGVAPALLRTRPAPGEWSANEVLAHLRACADVWGGCIATILAEDHPTIRAVNPRRWIDDTDYVELAFAESLRSFTEQRADLLSLIESLTEAQWSRSATVTGAGRPLEKSALDYASRLAAHEHTHLCQIEATVRAVTSP